MAKKKHRILNTELSIAAHRAGSEYFRLRHDVGKKARLIEQVILYERVYLTTKNFLIIPLLVEWAGMGNLLKLLKNNVIGFVRPKGLVAYDGKYSGVEWMEVFFPRLEGSFDKEWLKIADTANIEEAAKAVLTKTLANHQDSDLQELHDLVVRNTKPFGYEEFGKRIKEETEKDFLDGQIRKHLLIKAKDVAEAGDISDHEIKIGFGDKEFDPVTSREIDKVLAIAFTNFDLLMGQAIGDVDIHTDNLSARILTAKLMRNLRHALESDGLKNLMRLKRIPDFRSLVENGRLNFNNLFELTYTSDNMKFRDWLHNMNLSAPNDVPYKYNEELERSYGMSQNMPLRIIRFLTTVALGIVVNPAVGLSAAFCDSFIVDQLLKKWHPRLFLDKLRSILE